jgi:gamma-glutamyltranspeptidase/glutathione hydrolase
MKFDPLNYPYPSKRTVVYAKNGIVATSQHLAAQAGLNVLKKGGNAIDAAVAAAACLTVVEPTSNGIGGDAFALIWSGGKLYGINGSGPSPKRISIEAVREKGISSMPEYGWLPVNVPGVPATWSELSARFGKLPLSEALKPAIDYASEGFPVSPVVSLYWQKAFDTYSNLRGEEQFKYWFDHFCPSGKAPLPGELWHSEATAKTLEEIGKTNSASFYKGDLADRIDRFSVKYGGYLRKDDLENYSVEFVEPVSVNYRGYDIWELPPNGQGLVTLMALNILKGFEFYERDTADTYHKQIEAIKLAFADGMHYITDSCHMDVGIGALLSEEYASDRRKLIGKTAAAPLPGKPPQGGTVYISTADSDGNMVSYIQSNYMGFGSGLIVPGTGISLHNRGYTFSLDPSHCNCLKPCKKTYHTIIPGFITRGGKPVGPFGVMGAYMQPQGHLQMVMNMVDFDLNPQASLDAPRWRWLEGKRILLEDSVPKDIGDSLAEMGHEIDYSANLSSFGRGQIILRQENNVLAAGTEPRADSLAAAW